MQRLNSDDAASAIIPHFLRSVLKAERERIGLSPKDASSEAGWPAAQWGALENGARALDREQWTQAADVLGLTPSDLVRRFDAFIVKNLSIWIEISIHGDLSI